MASSVPNPDEQVTGVRFTKDLLVVDLRDGRTISVPLAWYPRLLHATQRQRANWKPASGGFGIHWPDIDEDLSTEGLLREAPAPRASTRLSAQKRPLRDGSLERTNPPARPRWDQNSERVITGTEAPSFSWRSRGTYPVRPQRLRWRRATTVDMQLCKPDPGTTAYR
jgi:hypothetical protein